MTERKRFPRWVYLGIMKSQRNRCALTGEKLKRGRIRIDHKIALHLGGEDTPENLQAVNAEPHDVKSGNEARERAKVKRIQRQAGLLKPKESQKARAERRMAEMKGSSW